MPASDPTHPSEMAPGLPRFPNRNRHAQQGRRHASVVRTLELERHIPRTQTTQNGSAGILVEVGGRVMPGNDNYGAPSDADQRGTGGKHRRRLAGGAA